MKNIVVIGGGFAGLWSAATAARNLELMGEKANITLINKDSYHYIRVRNYEDELEDTRIPLASVLDPIGVELVLGKATGVDTVEKMVTVDSSGAQRQLSYDKLILASGSHLTRPATPGVVEHTFDIDTYAAAVRLQTHINGLGAKPVKPGLLTAVVVGSGATGVELACELPARMRAALAVLGRSDSADDVRVILADRGPAISGQLGGAQTVIKHACQELGVELLPGFSLASVDSSGLTLADGTRIEASTVVWCAGMKAADLTSSIPGERDASGRLYVDSYMRVKGVEDVYAAGDAAHALIDGERPSVMSCQHARPMGRYAGHNAVSELFGAEMLSLNIDWYTNIIDLGPWGAVYSQGWDRVVVAHGEEAKKTKSIINRQRIYPPRNGDREAIYAAAAPDIQAPPVLAPSKLGELDKKTAVV
ncbi:NADH dehydrogenase-like protein [compost metagenome]